MPGRNRTNKPNVAHFGPKFPCNSGGLNPSPQRLVEDIGRRLEAERLSRPGVQLRCDLVEPGLADQVEVGPFRQVLAEEAVRVLVRAALPGATRVAEVDLDVGGDGELGVLGHPQAAIPGQRGAQLLRQTRDLTAERSDDRAGVLAADGDEDDEAGLALDQGRDLAVAAAGEQVAFPVARDRPVGRLRWALPDRDGAEDLSLAAVAAAGAPRPADRARPTQVLEQLALQGAAGLDEPGQVDRLVRHPHSLVLGVVRPQPTGDLLGRPVGGQLRGHERRQGRLTRELAVLRSPATLPGSPLCLGGTVAASAAVAVELARDRRRRSSEPGRDRPRRSAGGDAARDLLPLGQCQGKPAAPPLGRRQTATLPDLRIDRPRPPIERPPDLADRLTPSPALPQLLALLGRIPPAPPRHRNTSQLDSCPMLGRGVETAACYLESETLRGVDFDRLFAGLFAAELLVPPDGFAPLELRLRLADVRGELGFLLRQVRFELGEGRLAGLDLVGAQIDVCVQDGLALVDLALALVELADPVADRFLHRRQALLPALL